MFKNGKRAFGLLSLFLASLVLTAVSQIHVNKARAWDYQNSWLTGRALGLSYSRHVVTDQSIAFRLKYLGASSDGATVAIAAGGDMAFTTNGTTADSAVSSDGTIDLSTPAAGENTIGEVCDVINASGTWACVLVDVRPSVATDNTLSTLAETSTTTGLSATYNLDGNGVFDVEGLPVTIDTSDIAELTVGLTPAWYVNELLTVDNDDLLNRNPIPVSATASQWRAELYFARAQATYTTGAPDFEVYLAEQNADGTWGGAAEIQLVSETGAASATSITLSIADMNTDAPLRTGRGQMLFVTYDDDTTADTTAGYVDVLGLVWQE